MSKTVPVFPLLSTYLPAQTADRTAVAGTHNPLSAARYEKFSGGVARLKALAGRRRYGNATRTRLLATRDKNWHRNIATSPKLLSSLRTT